ncbi:uncharacterized protein C8Q71DRAFT_167082 [Rhodofomes roseus]|uniref:F-box domain-containing protein n=1 Tax=Rhodofomes roseus TaxID=34475 RepID=A0ABQ8KA44_9APHY|nr:uncharacterized protein C8Q71DRAFT_167082 [Rhodofomes roseus]KAH9834220.1 hypothetical protein C8Q71DRAFT_167082 [Rhodofomes roseus]
MEGASTKGTATPINSPQDAPAPRLPTEICGRIIDHLAAGLDLFYFALLNENPTLLALKSCALVCRDWYFHTWYHLRQRVCLRDRNDVRSLSRTLRERPRLWGVVQQVVISGHTSGQRSPIQHLGTFAATLAGKLPTFWSMTIEDAEWTVGSIRMEDVGYLATFHLLRTLYISRVTVPSIGQLARLISALPGLEGLICVNVDCSQKHPNSPVSLPLNSASLEALGARWVAPAVEDLLVRISQISRLRWLNVGVEGDLNLSPTVSRRQALLDASAASVEVLQLYMGGPRSGSCMNSDTVDSTVGRHYNLSRYESLWQLQIFLYHPFAEWSSIPHIVSRILPKHLLAMSIMLFITADHAADDFDGAMMMMEEDGTLVQLDDTLQAECFTNIEPGGICLGFDTVQNWRPSYKLFGSESSFGERCCRWDELVKRKMPQCNGRGILTYVV